MESTFFVYSGYEGGDTWVECTVADLENLQRPNIDIHPTAIIGKGTYIDGHTIIGENVRIGDYSYIQGTIGKGTNIGKCTKIGSGVNIGEFCQIGNHVTIDELCSMEEGANIGDHSIIGRCTKLGDTTIIHNHVIVGSFVNFLDCVVVSDHVSIDDQAVIEYGAHIASGVNIGYHARIGRKSYIGEQSIIGEMAIVEELTYIDRSAEVLSIEKVAKDKKLIRANIKGHDYSLNLIGDTIYFEYLSQIVLSEHMDKWIENPEGLIQKSHYMRSHRDEFLSEILDCVKQLTMFHQAVSGITFQGLTEEEMKSRVR